MFNRMIDMLHNLINISSLFIFNLVYRSYLSITKRRSYIMEHYKKLNLGLSLFSYFYHLLKYLNMGRHVLVTGVLDYTV